jgi:hypothetical protein
MLWPFYFSYSTRFIARETREQGNTVRGKGKGEREKGKGFKYIRPVALMAFWTLLVKGIHLYWRKVKYQTCTPFSRLLLEV